jgi:hypothetical protein
MLATLLQCSYTEVVNSMLKITIHDNAQELRFKLEGRLSGLWVEELRQCWHTARSTTAGRQTVVEFDDVDFVCPEGESLLDEMHQAGVRLIAATPVPCGVIEGIQQRAGCDTVEAKPSQASDVLFQRHTKRPDSRAS